MMLNISYNMNNNINHSSDSGAHFLFNQDPRSLLGGLTHSDEQQKSLVERSHRVF